jgi:glycosyltransferase involved in cell wall biosynthesis
MSVKIIVAGSFHAFQVAEAIKIFDNNVVIISSTPFSFWRSNGFNGKVIFIPLFFQIIRKLTGRRLFSWQKHFDLLLFDFISSFFVNKDDDVYGFAGCSLLSGLKAKKFGNKYILDRACPHFIFQETLLQNEYNKLSLKFFNSSESLRKRLNLEYLNSDYIVVPSIYTFNSFKNFPILCLKLKIISIPPKKIKQNLNQSLLKYNNSNVVIGAIGADLVRKGFFYLFESWLKFNNLKNLKLLVRAPLAQLNHSILTKSLIDNFDNVLFPSYFKSIDEFYNLIDILVLPSIDEGFGMVVLEAMSHGIPVIVTESVGASDIVEKAKSGLIIHSMSSNEIYLAIDMLVRNPGLRLEYGSNGYSYFNDKYLNNSNSYSLQLKNILNK